MIQERGRVFSCLSPDAKRSDRSSKMNINFVSELIQKLSVYTWSNCQIHQTQHVYLCLGGQNDCASFSDYRNFVLTQKNEKSSFFYIKPPQVKSIRIWRENDYPLTMDQPRMRQLSSAMRDILDMMTKRTKIVIVGQDIGCEAVLVLFMGFQEIGIARILLFDECF